MIWVVFLYIIWLVLGLIGGVYGLVDHYRKLKPTTIGDLLLALGLPFVPLINIAWIFCMISVLWDKYGKAVLWQKKKQ